MYNLNVSYDFNLDSNERDDNISDTIKKKPNEDKLDEGSLQGEDYSLDENEEMEILDDTTTEFNYVENELMKSVTQPIEKGFNGFGKISDKSSFKE